MIHKIHLFSLNSKYFKCSIAAQSLTPRMSANTFMMSFRPVRNKDLITRHEETLLTMQFSLYHSEWFSSRNSLFFSPILRWGKARQERKGYFADVIQVLITTPTSPQWTRHRC